ncbi:MAG: type I-E CRISPR-associated protein Cas7/Cse4/CasC [Ruminococcus sp.]|nr:type I-E CRISPR-associated protein Cas7/Cse4/CasC [Ruminococcus sp.]
MDNQRFYVDIHVLQTVPPSCVNRDDTGRPKTAMYGGANRARVSSQAWKHSVREYFHGLFTEDKLGSRTKYAVKLIAAGLKKLSPELDDAKAEKTAAEALANAGLKINEKKNNTTGALFFISEIQAKKLAELAANGEKDKKAYKEALRSAPSIDIALFGRMAADDADLNVDAACQVAHSISTHVVTNEYDYFTAVDDCSPEDSAGAGHLGTMEFNSSTLYRYATVNVTDLIGLIGADAAEAVKGFAEAFICSMPTGKQNSYANRTLPDMVYVTVRKDQPVNLCGAFEKPVVSKEGYIALSKKALFEHAGKVYDDFCGNPEYSFVVGNESMLGAEKVSLNGLLDKLSELVGGVV